MLKLSLKGVNTHARARAHTQETRAYSVSKQSKHIITLVSEGVHHPSDFHKGSAANAA